MNYDAKEVYAALLDRAPKASELKSGDDENLIRRIMFSDEFLLLHEKQLNSISFKDRSTEHIVHLEKRVVIDINYIDDLFSAVGDDAFVVGCYQIFLGRAPENGVLSSQIEEVGRVGRFAYARKVMRSDEATGKRRLIVVTQDARDHFDRLEDEDALRRGVAEVAEVPEAEHL